MRDFIDWQDLTEATGVDKDRVQRGLISFQKGGKIWSVPKEGGWTFSLRYAPNAPKVSTTKKVGAKPVMKMVELPEYAKLVKSVKIWLGNVTAEKAKSIVVIKAKSGSEQIVFGRYYSSTDEPRAINNNDFKDKDYLRATESGGQMIQLTANEFLVGSPTKTFPYKDEPTEHFVFKNMNQLKSKILENMKASKIATLKNAAVIDETKKFLDLLQKTGTATFNWDRIGKLMNNEDRKKFGIFLVSEIGWPFIVMGSGKSIGAGFPGLRSIDFFGVPVSSSNAGYDSCLKGTLTTGGKGYVWISSKAKLKGGKPGARPSALPMMRETAAALAKSGSKPNNPFFASLMPYINNIIVPKSPGASVVMHYGIREIAGISEGTIPDTIKFWKIICAMNGYQSGNKPKSDEERVKRIKQLLSVYKKEEIDQAKKGLLVIQKKFSSGLKLPGIKVAGVIDQSIAGFLQPKQLNQFAQYLPTAFCKLIIQGMNYDTSDFVPPKMWQVTADNSSFITSGTAHLDARYLGGGDFKYHFTPGKNPDHDPTHDTTWIGYDPL